MATMYYGSKMSRNKTKTTEGYLVCHNVPIGRCGAQDYLGREISPELDHDEIFKVYRNPEEVFAPATIASFEGKSVTDLHPPKNLDAHSYSAYEKGHVQNVRQGTGDESEHLIADLVIKDLKLISDIENGIKKEVSCGYDCLWVETDGGFEQKEIRGNHVAVVPDGRAGGRVAIKDQKPKYKGGNKVLTKSQKKKNLMGRVLAAFARDAEPEELVEAMDVFGAPESEEGTEQKQSGFQEQGQKEDDDIGGDTLNKILQAIQGIDARLSKLEQSDADVHSEFSAEKALDALSSEIESDPETNESGVVEDEALPAAETLSGEELPKNPIGDSKAFIAKMKPIICAIPDAKARKAAADALIGMFSNKNSANGYAKIQSTVLSAQKKAIADAAAKQAEIRTMAEIACDNFNKAFKGGK